MSKLPGNKPCRALFYRPIIKLIKLRKRNTDMIQNKTKQRTALIGCLIMTLILALSLPNLPAEITMQQAIQSGIQMSSAFQNQVLETHSLELLEKTARLKKWFNIDSGGSYLYRSEQMEITLPDMNPAPGIIIPGSSMTVGAKHNYDLKLSLTQAIFTGEILTNNAKLAGVKLAAAEKQLLLSKIETAAGIKKSYFNYRLFRDQSEIAQALLKQLQLHLRRQQDFYKEELIKKSDLLETEARLQEQTLKLLELQLLVENEGIHFKSLCGYAVEEIEPNYSEKETDFTRALADFKTGHPMLKALADQIAVYGIQEKIAAGEYLPRIGGFAELHYGKPGIDFFQNEWSIYFQGGVSVDFKIFDWSKQKRDRQIIRYGAEKIKNQQNDFIDQGETALKQLFAAKSTALIRLAAVEKLVQIAAEDSKLKEALLNEQQIANIDYLSALTNEERYISLKKSIQAQLELIKVDIYRLTGKFEEDR